MTRNQYYGGMNRRFDKRAAEPDGLPDGGCVAID